MVLSLSTMSGGKRKRVRRLGRGNASGRGTYAGRGQKGQRARSGGRHGLKQRALRQLFQHLPKLGGFRSLKAKAVAVNLNELCCHFSPGASVNPKILINKGLVRHGRPVKILSSGIIDRALHIKGCKISASAKEKIIAAGGSIT